MIRRLTDLWDRAGKISHRNFVVLAGCSLIATAAVIGGTLTGTGLPTSALAALLGDSPEAGTADEPAADVPVPDLESATPGPSGSAPGPAPGPAAQTPAGEEDPARTTPDPTTPEPTPPEPATGPFQHVFVINLTSPGFDDSFGDSSRMPYLSQTLRPQGTLLSGYGLLDDNGLPNLIGMVSGQRPNAKTKEDCSSYDEFAAKTAPDDDGFVDGDGCIYPVDVLSVADQVASSGRFWHAYVEGMAGESGPANCVRPTPNETDDTEQLSGGEYTARHNPFVYFHSLLDLGSCGSNDVPLDQLPADLKSVSTTPNLSFITPSLCHSGVADACADGGPGAADAYLSKLVPKILGSAAYEQDGLLLVGFDELDSEASGSRADPVGLLAVSSLTPPGGTIASRFDPYSVLRTLEDLFGQTPLASAAEADSFATDIVNSGD